MGVGGGASSASLGAKDGTDTSIPGAGSEQEAGSEQRRGRDEMVQDAQFPLNEDATAVEGGGTADSASHPDAATVATGASGDVVLRYNMYAERFSVVEGRLHAASIDEVYCLSDVMPGCRIHLSAR